MNRFLITLGIIISLGLGAQIPEGTVLYDRHGERVEWDQLINDLEKSQFILFGELHGTRACHEMEVYLARTLHQRRGDKLVLGGEMWEADQQLLADEFTSGKITAKQYKADARVWLNFDSDYLPFMTIAQEKNLRFIATNIPRRYASVVYHQGSEALLNFSKDAKSLMPKLPFTFDAEMPIYQEISGAVGGHGSPNLAAAQAFKDATMARYILENTGKKETFFHINGEYHSREFQGIYQYLRVGNKKAQIRSISCVFQEKTSRLHPDNLDRADYILVIKSPEKEDNGQAEGSH
jgi:uncharacterized iron-regulated protein